MQTKRATVDVLDVDVIDVDVIDVDPYSVKVPTWGIFDNAAEVFTSTTVNASHDGPKVAVNTATGSASCPVGEINTPLGPKPV